ncbi:MAG: hypothetical protein ACPGGK_13030 [Pikeienuella sp.]
MSEPRQELLKYTEGEITDALDPLSWELIKARADHMDHCALGGVSADATLILALVLRIVTEIESHNSPITNQPIGESNA